MLAGQSSVLSALGCPLSLLGSGHSDEICQVEQDRGDLWFLLWSLHFFRSGLVSGVQAFRVRVEHTLPLTLHGSGAKRDRDRAGRSKRPVAMGPVAQLLLPSASLGFLLQWTPGALCVAIPSSLERRLPLTPYPFQCLVFVGGSRSTLGNQLIFVVCVCFSVLGTEPRASCMLGQASTVQQHP